MNKLAVCCEHVTKRYGDTYALNDLNLEIPIGSVVGILGSNGAGKSTLFRIIMGLVRADSGAIRVLGQTPGWETNKGIAYLPDRARWYSYHTVQMAFKWAKNLLPNFNLDEANKLAALMEIDPNMKVNGMSKGQEARLMLILCIARNVPLVILDEPFSGIDTISREQIIEGLIDYISDREQTVLISTHEIYEAEGLFDHAVFLNNGQVTLSGKSEELRAKYGSLHSIPRQIFK